MTLTSTKGEKVHTTINAFVIDNLQECVLISENWFTDTCALRTSDELYIPKKKTKQRIKLAEAEEKCHQIQIHNRDNTNPLTAHVQSQRSILIPPKSYSLIDSRVDSGPGRKLRHGRIAIINHPHANPIIEQYTDLKGSSMTTVPVFNPSEEPLWIRPGTLVALASEIPMDQIHINRAVLDDQQTKDLDDWTKEQEDSALEAALHKHGITDPLDKRTFKEEYKKKGSACLPVTGDIPGACPQFESGDEKFKTDDEIVASLDLTHLDDNKRTSVEALVRKNIAVFQRSRLHHQITNKLVAHLDFKPITSEPKLQRQFPMSYKQKEAMSKIIQQMLKCGIIERATEASPFLCNAFIIPKKDKKSHRILFDARLVNEALVRPATRMVTMAEIEVALAKSKFASSFDVSAAFFSIPIAKKDRRHLRFLDGDLNAWAYSVLPMGLRPSSHYLQQLLSITFAGMEAYVVYFADDILILGGDSWQEHLEIVDRALKRLIDANLLVPPKKSAIMTPTVEYLGCIFSLKKRTEIAIPKNKIRAYLDQKRPDTRRALVSFLASLNYHRRQFPHYSDTVHPLHVALAEDTSPKAKIKWTQDRITAYNALMDYLSTGAVTQCADPDKPFLIITDASQVAISGLAYQKDEKDEWKLVGSASRLLTQPELKRHVYEKEATAISHTLKTFEYFLRDAKITLLTDCRGLSYLRACRHSSPYLLRIACYITQFDLTVIHIPGSINAADYNSRMLEQRTADDGIGKTYLKGPDAAKLIEAVQFGKISLTPDEVRFFLAEIDSFPAPNQPPTPARASRRLPTVSTTLRPDTRSPRRITLPRASPFNPNLPNQQKLLNQEGFYNEEQAKIPNPKHPEKQIADITPGNTFTKEDLQYHGWMNQPTPRTVKEENWPSIAKRPIPPTPPASNTIHARMAITRAQAKQMATIHEHDTTDTDTPPTRPITPPSTDTATPPDTNPEEPQETEPDDPPDETDITPNPDDLAEAENLLSQMTTEGKAKLLNEHAQTLGRGEACCKDSEEGKDCEHSLTHRTWIALASWPSNPSLNPTDFRACQRSDPAIAKLEREIASGKKQPSFPLLDGLRCHQQANASTRLYLPKSILRHLVHIHHYGPLNAHRSPNKIARILEQEYYYPNLQQTIEEMIASCPICQKTNLERRPNKCSGTLKSPTKPREAYAIDFISGLPRSQNDNTTVLVVVDLFSLLPRFYAAKSRTADEVIRILRDIIRADISIPAFIRSDNESCLDTTAFQDFLSEHNITHSRTAGNSPKSNKLAELQVKAFKTSARALAMEMPHEWDENLIYISLAHSKSIAVHGYSPEKAHFGTTTSAPTDPLLPDPKKPASIDVAKLHARIRELREDQRQKRLQKEAKKRDDRKEFDVGMMCMLFENPIKAGSTVEQRFSGPHVIVDIEKGSLACTIRSTVTDRIRKVTMANLKRIKEHPIGHPEAPTTCPT